MSNYTWFIKTKYLLHITYYYNHTFVLSLNVISTKCIFLSSNLLVGTEAKKYLHSYLWQMYINIMIQ